MKRLLVVLALTVPVFADTALFSKYEAVRQGLLKNRLGDVQKNAAALAHDAEAAKLPAIAEFAQSVSVAKNLADARRSFGVLSEEMIKIRDTAGTPKPAVYHCPMVKKSWLQAKGKVGNPYDAAMATCGELKAE
ncbi:MAG TPA: hypothetical protein VNI54_12145 [Thermoanaerobaculia bacterium]|nr:hypothetical protein [Thermoanaerobaculia bacterium]